MALLCTTFLPEERCDCSKGNHQNEKLGKNSSEKGWVCAYQENQKFLNYKIRTLKTEGGPQIFKMKFQMNFILVKDKS